MDKEAKATSENLEAKHQSMEMMTAKKIEGSAVIEVRISQKAARMANLEHYSAYLHN